MVLLIIECVLICLLMWLICFFATGNDEKNLKYIDSYPNELQDLILKNSKYKNQITIQKPIVKALINLIIFFIIIFIFGLFIKTDNFVTNFFNLLILGQTLNLFDLIVIDLIWWRNTKRIRLTEYPDKKLYQDVGNHFISFSKGLVMFAFIALIDGALLALF